MFTSASDFSSANRQLEAYANTRTYISFQVEKVLKTSTLLATNFCLANKLALYEGLNLDCVKNCEFSKNGGQH